MIIGVPKEIKLQEHRIGLTPDSVKILTKKGHEVLIQSNGGFEAGFTNESYKNAGAKIIDNAEEIFNRSEIIVKVKEPQMNEVKMIKENQIIYTYLHLAAAEDLTKGLMKTKSICIAIAVADCPDEVAKPATPPSNCAILLQQLNEDKYKQFDFL